MIIDYDVTEFFRVTCNGISDDERWRSEIVGPCVWMDPALKVPVAREDAAAHEISLLHRLRDRLIQRPRVANACHAAVSDDGKSQGL